MTIDIEAPDRRPTGAASRARRPAVAAAARVVAAVVIVSAVAGVGWGLLVPAQHFLVVSGGAVSLPGESGHRFDAVALFLCLGLILGVLSAVAVWSVQRAFRGLAQLVGLMLGSAVGAAAAALVGVGVAQLRFPAAEDVEIGRIVAATPGLDTVMALIAQPLAAALVYLLLVSISPHPDLVRASPSTAVAPDPAPPAVPR
ncbi:DUF2567 domain-containing protein [Rhodococcus sp. NPDC003318]|uniref:DUF2567 domain-containing protein n=1 Tax=Rhodococcus sp. NPDC003318 TaxID=3364503 RepID=UPI0036AE0EB4